MLTVTPDIRVPLREFHFTFSRSSGPGGQNVNKVNTKATLRWSVAATKSLPEGMRERFTAKYRRRITSEGDLLVISQRFRDQGRNVADCLEKLREMLLSVSVAPKPRKRTKPSRGSVKRRLEGKRRRAKTKQLRRRPASEE